MFGLGGTSKKEPIDETPRASGGTKGSTKTHTRRSSRQRPPPESPNSNNSHSVMSSDSESEVELLRRSSDRPSFLSKWTKRKATSPERSQSSGQSESQSSGSSFGDSDDSQSQSSGSHTGSHSGTISRSYSDVDSQGNTVYDESSPESPRSIHSPRFGGSQSFSVQSLESSTLISPESSMQSPEGSQMLSQSFTDTTTSPAHKLLIPMHSKTAFASPADSETLNSQQNLSSSVIDSATASSGDDTEDANDCTPGASPSNKRKSKQAPLSSKEILNHLIPPRLAAIHESMSQDEGENEGDRASLERHVLSGDDADDEMTTFSAGDDTITAGPSMDASHMSVDANLTFNSMDALANGGGQGYMVVRPFTLSPVDEASHEQHQSVGPTLTSSTYHSSSTQPRGSNKKSSEHRMKTERSERRDTEDDSVLEIGIELEKAKQEYENGPSTLQTINVGESEHQPHDDASAQTIPSFMNRNDIFYKSASDAVAALLTPREQTGRHVSHERPDVLSSVRTGGSSNSMELKLTPSGNQIHASTSNSSSTSVFQPPVEGKKAAVTSSSGRRDVSDYLINPKTEQKLESMEQKMLDPTKTLADLLTAIATPDDKSKMDLGFMVRRKNACGALKVMTNDARKRVRICWTVGVLPALTSVLTDSCDIDDESLFPDRRIRYEFEAARDRSISALLNLSMPKENRFAVFHTPGFIQAVTHLITQDYDTARRGCTAILAYLAKSPENRLLMVQIPGLLDALVPILQPMPPRVESGGVATSKKKHPYCSASEESAHDGHGKTGQKNRSISSEDSQITFKVVASQSPIELFGYDETADPMLRATRQNVFALLGHLSKEKDNAYYFARDNDLLPTMVQISNFHESPAHVLAVKFLANLSRHRLNTKIMVFQERDTVPALVKATSSEYDEARLHACYAIQNMAQDKSCRQELAGIEGLVTTLCRRGRYAQAEDERLSAISALKNLCDEPANLIPLTNTPECIATLMHLAHGREEGVTEMMQYRACDALATLSHWLRKIATSGQALEASKNGEHHDKSLFVPSLRVVTWNQWQ